MPDFDEHNPHVRVIFSLVMILVVIGGLWIAAGFIWPEDNGQVVILKADNAPFKVKPDDKGGMQIPHQDKLIFNTVSPEGKAVMVERILPAPEQPMNAPEPTMPVTPENAAVPAPSPASVPSVVNIPSPQAADAVLSRTATPSATQESQLNKPAPLPTAAKKVEPSAPVTPPVSAMGRVIEPATAPSPTTVPAQLGKPPAAFDMSKTQPLAAPAPAIKESTKDKDAAPALFIKEDPVKEEPEPVDAGPKSKARVKAAPEENQDDDEAPKKSSETKGDAKGHFQLASFFDKASADKGLAQFKSKYADALQRASLVIVSATLNNGKQVFRVQGNAPSADAAADICDAIKDKGGSCVTIR